MAESAPRARQPKSSATKIGNHLDGRGIVVYNEYDEAVE